MPDGDEDHVDSSAQLQAHLSDWSPPTFLAGPDHSDSQPPVPASSPDFPLLPRTTYSPPQASKPHRLSLTTSSTNQYRHLRDDLEPQSYSPDPREYYRQYTNPFQDAQTAPFGLGSILPAEVDCLQVSGRSLVESDASQWTGTSTPSFHQPPTSGFLASRRESTESFTRSQFTSPTRARLEQPSFKDLIQKFNNTVDEVPPVPSGPKSLLTSRPVTPLAYARSFRYRDGEGLGAKLEYRRREWDDCPLRHQLSVRSPPRNSTGSQSHRYSNLPNRFSADGDGACQLERSGSDRSIRPPLFGELLSIDTAVNYPGYGIPPSYPQRRGSDSSIPSPNPAILGKRIDIGTNISPSSPTAWYLGFTPSLEAVNTGTNSVSHRRARSEFSPIGANQAITSSLSTHMAVASLQEPASAAGLDTPHSKSRIPVATRRLSHASDSSNSSPSPRAGSASGFHPSNGPSIPPKNVSRIPKPSTKSPIQSKSGNPRIRLPIRFPTTDGMNYGDESGPYPEKESLLRAYISAPPQKKSPPLRSSRPRQPVSIAMTTTSRAKAVERLSHLQTQNSNDRDNRAPRTRTRRLPELSTVDYAARRQRIQQAFNESVQKEEAAAERRRLAAFKKDEEVRAQLLRKGEQRKMDSRAEPSYDEETTEERPNTYESVREDGDEQEDSNLSDEHPTPTAPHLTVETVTSPISRDLGSAQALPPDIGDSPTLGFAAEQMDEETEIDQSDSQVSDHPSPPPLTAETNETDIVQCDADPQVALREPEVSHRTVLSQIMQMRESSSSSQASSDDHECGSSASDEKESIQIMLAPSSFFDDSVDSSDNQEHQEICEEPDQLSEGMPNRWSMTSWSSFVRDRLSPEEQPELVDEHLSRTDQSNPLLPIASEKDDKGLQPLPTVAPQPSDLSEVLSEHSIVDTHSGIVYRSHAESILPNLARQGGWDSRRVTQLYLEEIYRGRILLPPGTKPFDGLRALDQEAEAMPKKDSLTDDPVMVPPAHELLSLDYKPHGSRLKLRDDWENASPSIVDWMQIAAEDAPTPPPKDNDKDQTTHEDPSTPKLMALEPTPSETGEAQDNLGQVIHVQPPGDEHASEIIAPPLPSHSPPPIPDPVVPAEAPPNDAVPQMISPSIYSTRPPSSTTLNTAFQPSDDQPQAKGSEESLLSQTVSTQSLPTPGSSVTSQQPVSANQPSVETKASSPSPEQRRLKKRRHIIKELVETEYTFGRDMKVVDDIYKGTSSSCLDLSADDVRTLFSNSDQIVQFSMIFQDALKRASRLKSQRWNSRRGTRAAQGGAPPDDPPLVVDAETSDLDLDNKTSIGQAFMENIAQMEKVYTDYLKNHDAANKTLVTLQRNQKVAIWLKECREHASDLTTAWNLDSLLVKPVQRILKYPLLLNELLQSTPEDHSDHPDIANALEAVTNITVRINELKRRADLVGQVVSSRKRKESDVRAGLSKAFGRRTEKLKQHVGLSEIFEDKEYDGLSQRFNDSFFQLQVVMRDVEMYAREAQAGVDRFHDFITAVEGYIDVALSNYTEIESKWRRFRMSVREVITVALPDHIATVRKSVIEPMVTLLKLHDGPQKVMQKRGKRLIDYTRFKAIKDRGDKPDKKTAEQGEQFVALNDALKDELPKLFSLTAKLMEACLDSFVEIQMRWLHLLQKKLGSLLDRLPEEISGIISDWSGDFSFAEAQVLSLGICNGSILADTVNLVNFNTPSTGTDVTSSPRPSTVNSSGNRASSFNAEGGSPKVSRDFGSSACVRPGQPRHSISSQSHHVVSGRNRTSSSLSNATRAAGMPELSNGHVPYPTTASQGPSTRPNTSSSRAVEQFPSPPRLSLDMPFMNDPLLHEGANHPENTGEATASPGGRYSGFFSSAMPMSDSPHQEAHPNPEPVKDPTVLFLAASLYEFNIDRARREAGYPYLTYVAGEIFDVIGEKGELWLARNQDDPTHQVGWIWNKHFAKLGT